MRLSLASVRRLSGLSPRLVAVVLAAADRSTQPFIVTEGLRTRERQSELYAQGRTAPGPKVTWTMESKHLRGEAIDIAPIKPDGTIDWADTKAFDAVAAAMLASARQLGVAIRWGADWDQDGQPRERGESDSPHFELV